MGSVQKGVYAVLKGEFLTDDRAVKNWRLVLFVVNLLLVMVWSGHSVDEKVGRIAQLNREKRELRAEYVDTKTSLATLKLESSVKKNVKEYGLANGSHPPLKIRVIVK